MLTPNIQQMYAVVWLGSELHLCMRQVAQPLRGANREMGSKCAALRSADFLRKKKKGEDFSLQEIKIPSEVIF